MRHIRRLVAGMAAGLTLVFTLGGAAAPAGAASIYWVDDTPANNGKVKCPAVGTFPTIEAARAQIATDGVTNNVTLNICPGSYAPPGAIIFSSFNNLKVIGKGGPYITAPNLFTGSFFYLVGSSKVTVQGLNISGASHLDNTGGDAVAINYNFSSGTVKGNTISRWHEAYSATPATPAAPAYGIVDFAPDEVEKVNITRNTIYDSQEVGIYVYEAGAAKVTKNRVVFSSAITPSPVYGITLVSPQVGILVLYSGPGTLVSGNQIQSDADLHPQAVYARGITLYSTSGAKVLKNTIRGTSYQISVESYCDVASFPNANNNLISGNKLYDTWNSGVFIQATDPPGGCAAPHADFNKVTGNKIYNSRVADGFPWGSVLAAGAPGVADHDVIKGNIFAGFLPSSIIVRSGDTNSTVAPNKILAAPPPGPLAAPSPEDHPLPGPLPASVLNPF